MLWVCCHSWYADKFLPFMVKDQVGFVGFNRVMIRIRVRARIRVSVRTRVMVR